MGAERSSNRRERGREAVVREAFGEKMNFFSEVRREGVPLRWAARGENTIPFRLGVLLSVASPSSDSRAIAR